MPFIDPEYQSFINQGGQDLGGTVHTATPIYDSLSWADIAVNADIVTSSFGDVFSQTRGNFSRLAQFKAIANSTKYQKDLKLILSIGGWTLSENFSAVAADESKRAKLITDIKRFLIDFPQFDGIDIDWEFPVWGNGEYPALHTDNNDPISMINPYYQDADNYLALIKDIRIGLDELSVANDDRQYYLSIAINQAPQNIDLNKYGEMSQYLDHINTMSYDATGAFNPNTGNQAVLSNAAESDSPISLITENKWNIMDTVKALENQGVPTHKIVVGLPSYGRVWENVEPGSNNLHGMFETGVQPTQKEWEAGAISYGCMLNDLFAGSNTAAFTYCNTNFSFNTTVDYSYLLVRGDNDELKALKSYHNLPSHGDTTFNFSGTDYPFNKVIASYYYDPLNKRFITYDSPTMIGIKTQWVENKRLGGVMFWEVNTMAKSSTSPNLFNISYNIFGNDN